MRCENENCLYNPYKDINYGVRFTFGDIEVVVIFCKGCYDHYNNMWRKQD